VAANIAKAKTLGVIKNKYQTLNQIKIEFIRFK